MNTKQPSPEKPLKQTLFDRIESEQLCPRSSFSFACQECLVWLLWLISVMIGALAVAVSLFVVTHSQYALYEATHENFLTFMVEALPYIWLVLFALTVYLAIYNFRHTKHGYRYPLIVIVFGGVILSFAGGSALQLFGFGYAVDDILGRNMPMYQSQSQLEQKMWQRPKVGRLVGRQLSALSTSTIIFEDVQGHSWQMSVAELQPRARELLSSGKTVRLLGECLDKEANIFHACVAFPWMVDASVTVEDMIRERKAFMTSMNSYAEKRNSWQQTAVGTTSLMKQSICLEMMPIDRVGAMIVN